MSNCFAQNRFRSKWPMFFKLQSYTLLHFNDQKNNINVYKKDYNYIFSVINALSRLWQTKLKTIKRFNETFSPTKTTNLPVNHNDFIYHNDRPGHFPPRNMGFDKRWIRGPCNVVRITMHVLTGWVWIRPVKVLWPFESAWGNECLFLWTILVEDN